MVFQFYGISRISAASEPRRLLTFLSQMRLLFEGGTYSGAYSSKYGIPNQWIVFNVRSDWLLKLGIVSAIHFPAFFFRISRASFPSFPRKKEPFGASSMSNQYCKARAIRAVFR